MVIAVRPVTSIIQLEKFLKELMDQISSSCKITQENTSNWSYLANYYKEKEFNDLENQKGRIILDIFLASLIIWILEDILGSAHRKFPSVDEILEKARQAGIFFDLAFKNRIKSSFQLAQDLNVDLIKIQEVIPKLNLRKLLGEDLIGTQIQNLLPQKLRKSLAANFTSLISAKFLAVLSIKEDIGKVIDPFSGSGRLLTALIGEYQHYNALRVPSIALNELLDLAAYISALRILHSHQKLNQKPKMTIHLGDAFSKLLDPEKIDSAPIGLHEKAHLVIMNPPFTRYLRLSNQYLQILKAACRSYERFMSPQMGLHVFSLFLADSILTAGGRIAAILPAPTFYSKYSEGLKEFLLSKYQIRAIVGTSTDKSFSEGSDLKEVMLIADKRKKGEKATDDVLFVTVNEELTNDNFRNMASSIWERSDDEFDISYRIVSHGELRQNWNWIKFLEHDKLHSLAMILKDSSNICTAGSLGLRIVRGFEMYGPNFFFLPNNDWTKTDEKKDEVFFAHNDSGKSYAFPRTILQLALRKPSFYTKSVSPQIAHYVLRIKEGQEYLVPQGYIAEREAIWQIAEKRFGKKWINHINQQLNSKKPFGQLFVVDKFGITTAGTIIHYFDEPVTASKNFCLFDCEPGLAKILAAWMSSTLFILLFLAARREIGGSFGRLQIVDYQAESIFLDPSRISEESQKNILTAFDKYRVFQLPALRNQIGWPPRKALDMAILNALEIQEEFLQELYETVTTVFTEADNRGGKRRGRE
ncbi:MAG: Eco57I restriction-modification methylase domain-containing protein [Candidatus Heimdallarchaeota archaeon]